jgi:hypothetical protein
LVSNINGERRLRVVENRVLRRIFGLQRDEVTGSWRKLCSEELHNVNYSPSKIEMMKWAGHMVRKERRETRVGYWSESQKEKVH